MKNTINLYLALGVTLTAIFAITWQYDKYFDRVWEQNQKLTANIQLLEQTVESMQLTTIPVVATMYHPVENQTDKDPHITADGTRIHRLYASKYRFLAVSRNLLKRNGGHLNYGDYVVIENTNGKYNGIWQVKDTMNARFHNRIDFLCSIGTKQFRFDNATLTIL